MSSYEFDIFIELASCIKYLRQQYDPDHCKIWDVIGSLSPCMRVVKQKIEQRAFWKLYKHHCYYTSAHTALLHSHTLSSNTLAHT